MRRSTTVFLATLTALITGLGVVLLVGMLPTWPWLARGVLERQMSLSTYLLADAAFCLGPLCAPLLVLLAAMGVHAAWHHRTEASGLCATALGGWAGAAGVAAVLLLPQ